MASAGVLELRAAPPVTSGLVLWLESDRGVGFGSGNVVSKWSDQSGMRNDMTARGTPTLVSTATPSGAKAIRLKGKPDLLERGYPVSAVQGLPIGNANRTAFMVAKYNSSTAWAGLSWGAGRPNQAYGLIVKHPSGELVLHGWGAGNDLVSTTKGVGAGWLVQSGVLYGGRSTLFKNGAAISSSAHNYATTQHRLVVGEEISRLGSAGMDVAAVLIYNRALSDTERKSVESYLQLKYLRAVASTPPTDSVTPPPPSPSPSPPVTEPTPTSIKLFNGTSLSGLYVWSQQYGFSDPKGVFKVVDGMIHVAGDQPYVGLMTQKEYANYKVVLEFKWGTRTFGARQGKARDAGLLLHSKGAHGGWRGRLMPNIEAQIMEGSMGDLMLLKGIGAMSITSAISPVAPLANSWNYRGGYRWAPGGRVRTFSNDLDTIHWSKWDPAWKDVAGYRGANDLEKPLGQWNQMVVIAAGNRLEVYFNGVKVNEATGVYPTSGKLQLESEQAEYFVRRWELYPLN